MRYKRYHAGTPIEDEAVIAILIRVTLSGDKIGGMGLEGYEGPVGADGWGVAQVIPSGGRAI
jgi:hypothetical protein